MLRRRARSARRPLPRVLVALTLALGAAACGSGDEPDDRADGSAVAADTGPTGPTGSTADSRPEQPVTTVTAAGPAPADEMVEAVPPAAAVAWLGTYEWVESVEGLSGVNQTIAHDLVLDAEDAAGPGLEGRLDQNGFQTSRRFAVRAVLAGGDLVVEAAEAAEPVEVGQVLLRLGGTPDRPMTTLGALPTLVEDRAARGVYFRPAVPPAPQPAPADLWAVEEGTYDLVRLDRASGSVLDRIAGWGAEAAASGDGGGQALQTVEVAGDGRLWVTDCCEPAVGTVHVLRPGPSTDLDSAEFRVGGLGPQVSADGSLAAVSVLDLGIQIIDAATGTAIESAGLLDGLIGRPDHEADRPVAAWPLAWLDGGVLAVATVEGAWSTVSWIDVSDPAAPAAARPPVTVEGMAIDGSRAPGGRLAVLVRRPIGPAGEVLVFEPLGGVPVDRFGVSDNVVAIDYPTGGTALLQVLEGGALDVLGDGGALAGLRGGYVDAGW